MSRRPARVKLRGMRRGALALAVLSMTIGAGPAPAAAAESARLHCGQVIDDRAVLDRDLVCDGPGLILRNPRTVLQLNGHSLRSRRSCREGAASTGLVIEATADGAQVLGPGAVQGFVVDIQLTGAARVHVRDLRLADGCTYGLAIAEASSTRVEGVTFHRNGSEEENGAAVRVDTADRVTLAGNDFFLNGHGQHSAAIDLRRCEQCRVAANHVTANRGAGLLLDNAPDDIVDESPDATFVLNEFERGDGVAPPALWPLRGQSQVGLPTVAGCATVSDYVKPHEAITVGCPQDPQLRGLRNSVVGYRLLLGGAPYGAGCSSVDIKPASSTGGGSVTCTSPQPVFGLTLEVTCCLN